MVAAPADSKPGPSPTQAAQARARQLLQLKRERILSERTSNPIRRAALEAALAEIESELRQLDCEAEPSAPVANLNKP